MSKFFICEDASGSVFDCTTTLREAKDIVGAQGHGRILSVDVPITKDTVQKLLGNLGGYANETKEYWV